jgi:hypothetical protein
MMTRLMSAKKIKFLNSFAREGNWDEGDNDLTRE